MDFARKFFGWAAVVLITVYIGGNLRENAQAPSGDAVYKPGSGWEKAPAVAWAPLFDEVEAVTDCDMLALRQLKAPDTVDWNWSWRVLEHPERKRITILRGYSAQNAFGAQLAAHYRCLLDVSGSSRILEVNVAEGQL